MSTFRQRSPGESLDQRLDQQLQRLFVVFACDALIVTLASVCTPADSPLDWSTPLIPLATLAAFFPAAMGSAALFLRRSRFTLLAGTLAAGLTMYVVVGDLLQLEGTLFGMAAVAAFGLQVVIGLLGRRLAMRNVLPKSLRLAIFAFLFKLAVAGFLAAAFVPEGRNPLRLTGLTPTVDAGADADGQL